MSIKAVRNTKEKINPKAMQKAYLAKTESDLESQGVVFWEAEKNLNIQDDYLILPAEITEVPSRELGEYLNAFTQQKMYLRTLCGRVEIEVERARRNYVKSSERIYATLSNGKLSETAKERLINSDSEVEPYYYEFREWSQKLSMLNQNIANIEDAIFLLSREVSRRTSDFDDENRNYNVGKK